jgi:hypothetical protein
MYKFWIKSFAWLQGANDIKCEFLIWLDSDIITDKRIDQHWLDSIIDQEALITDIPSGDFLKDKESETGFAVLNFKNPFAQEFINEYKKHYDDNTITNLHRHIDSAVWWNTTKILETKTTCAELDLFLRLKNKTNIPYNKLRIVNVRLDKNLKIRNSKCCRSCKSLIDYMKPKSMYYTTEEGIFKIYE